MLTGLALILIGICTVFDCCRFKNLEDEIEDLRNQLKDMEK